MSLTAAEQEIACMRGGGEGGASAPETAGSLPAEVSWEMLDKSRFFVLGAALFSGVSAALYPAVVLKTHLQVPQHSQQPRPLLTAAQILRTDGPRGFYRGFGTSLAGTVPARALYMAALESTKSAVGTAALRLGLPEPVASTTASAAAGVNAAIAAQLVWTPVDVISQRLMIHKHKYLGGVDALKKIIKYEGLNGLYRGFGVSILTYAPSNAVWWASYSVSQRFIWQLVGYDNSDYRSVMAVQGLSAAMAGGAAAVVTMPLDTIKTRMQVMDCGGSMRRTVKGLIKEGGLSACFRGLGPRWASMSLSAATMITTYEFVKRLSAKPDLNENG
ncbi:solute carrier family 25 member 44-like protein [Carex littledalei]|uniref:Solute carrier family 25 member 44-like protein n=1 Tax=Carex littledalei TaxID=544730 RepID=A0A833QIS9_9POAL|nr:solute carrier family 25 member 44-like protein [Carex littledalei]